MDSSEEAAALLHEALDAGVNHLDIAPGYGSAERAVGPHLKAIRQRLFLACKTAETERDWALRRLDRSLERLQVDELDLYQAHGVTSLEVLDQRDEAFEVILEARDRGLTKFVGVTGHDLGAPRAHLSVRQKKRPSKCGFLIMTAQKGKIAATAFAVWQSTHTTGWGRSGLRVQPVEGPGIGRGGYGHVANR